MLVDNRFIYVNLPRCGSTSFHYSCIIHDLDVKNLNNSWGETNSKIDFKNVDESNIMNLISHGHERLPLLREKFGYHYPIIAVKRDRHEIFYSLYKHFLFDLQRAGALKSYEYFKNIDLNELFFYKPEDIFSSEKRYKIINDFLVEKKLIGENSISEKLTLNSEKYVINILNILITPSSYWHNHDKDIIWFDIKDLTLMEKWVSDTIGKSFKLKQVNSSQHIETNLKLDDDFKKKYNNIYDYYDLQKEKTTLI